MRAMTTCITGTFILLLMASTFFRAHPAYGDDELSGHALAEQLVFKGRMNPRVVACVACHRSSGQGDAASAFGNLTGLTQDYLTKQLKDYRSGERENRVMQVITKQLSDNDIEALANFYAKIEAPKSAIAIPEAPDIGVKLAEEGDDERGIAPCIACHGNEARESNNEIPNLFGQHALYITNQLTAWQDGSRKNDPGSVMSQIAKKLSPDEIAAIAIYFARRARANTQ